MFKNTALYIKSKFSLLRKEEKGLSLIEVAIGLILLGLITVPLIQSYKLDIATTTYRSNEGSLVNLREAINQYYASGNAAYPCPTDLTEKPGDIDFGDTGDCANFASILLCSDPGWRAAGGICKTSNNSSAVIIGGIPFAELNITQEEALDFWGNKLIYAVTHQQTDSALFTSDPGKVRVLSPDDPALVALGVEDGVPDLSGTNFDFFIFTTGRSALGGYTKNGTQTAPCGGISTGYDHENCDFDNLFFLHEDQGNTAASAYSEATGATFFDDITLGQLSLPENTWFQHPDNPAYVSKDFVMTLANRIGIGPDMTEPDFDIHVNGDIRTENTSGTNGRVLSDTICDIDANDCFDPEIITGTEPSMECAQINGTDRAVMRLRNSGVECSHPENISGNVQLRVDTTEIHTFDCGDGQRVTGIQANGDLICAVP